MKYQRSLDLAESLINPAWDFIKEVPSDSLLGNLRGEGRFTPTQTDWERQGRDHRDTEMPKFYRSYVTSRWCWGSPPRRPSPGSSRFWTGVQWWRSGPGTATGRGC